MGDIYTSRRHGIIIKMLNILQKKLVIEATDDDDDDADDDNLDVAFDFLKYSVAMLHDENEVIEVMKVRKLS